MKKLPNQRLKLSGAACFRLVPLDEMAQQPWNVG
jgi:hypothetical protein